MYKILIKFLNCLKTSNFDGTTIGENRRPNYPKPEITPGRHFGSLPRHPKPNIKPPPENINCCCCRKDK